MACRQILPCRRYCRLRPFLLVLVLAAYLFYQTLTPLRARRYLPAVDNGVLSTTQEVQQSVYKEVPTRQFYCVFPSRNLQLQKEIKDAISKYIRSQANSVILYIPSSSNKEDLQLYQHILTQHSFAVTVLEDRKLNGQKKLHPDELNSWELMICLSSSKAEYENCLATLDSHQTMLLQKANVLPQIGHLLCRKEGLCQILRTFPELHLPVALSACPDLFLASDSIIAPGYLQAVKSHNNHGRSRLVQGSDLPTENMQQHSTYASAERKESFKIQDLSVIIKAYVLVTSLTPLRAFLHSTGIVLYPSKKKHFSVKLQTFFENFLKANSPQQAFDDMKEAIIKLLLIAEVFSDEFASRPKAFTQCSLCFQMLTFDIGFNLSMYPVILEIHEHFDFQADDGTGYEDQIVKETLLKDTFRILLSNKSSYSTFFEALWSVYRSAEIKDEHYLKESDQCLTLEELISLSSFVKELQNQGQFELLFPSADPKIHFLLHDLYRLVKPKKKLGSVLTIHWLLSNLLEQLQIIKKRKHTRFAGWNSYSGKGSIKGVSSTLTAKSKDLHFLNQAEDAHCSHDKDALTHIRQIFTNPRLDLNPKFDPNIKEYYTEVPFDVVTVKIRAEPVNCHGEVHLDEKKGPSTANYPLGLGINRVNILVTSTYHSLHEVVSIYKIVIYREDRPSMPLFEDFTMCGFAQECGLLIHPEESCGLQPLSAEYLSTISQPQLKTCETGDTQGQWIVPCLSCSDNRTCDWRQIAWQPHNCQYPVINKPELQQCLENKKVLFIGDSTNRGMMYYLIERVNKTLQEWQKTHDMKFYYNINNRNTFISYSYYPQFWISGTQRPTFEEALEQLLRRANLSNILVVIKSLGMGFHLPVDGVHSLSLAQVQKLWNENQAILKMAKQYGYEVVDTFIITMGRYKEFLQGKCGCHFHEVVKSKTSEGSSPMTMTLSKPYTLGKYFSNQSSLMQLQAYSSNSQSPYHVRGPVNQVYSEILLNRICANHRKVVGI
ncbi:cadherin-like and PC-esterase domain-containing protein 1 isoform X2 [Sphaerodactylus townsendi]|uniref:cadherin-like and PC-esterase domain-containing protein 1 isoform X2 n=1 Tax=Sphaerodactylus townsendi TaxID=933632 RepID=UPI0020273415|nr:cadherin-like and PC-esterase domain-containing protein 1 isoform X2 [Sphaerodactylus townsendi]